MKKQSIKILMAVVLVLALVFSMTAVSFAGDKDNGQIQLRTVVNIAKSFVADSSKKATATVRATSSGYTPYITSKITLQSAPLGSDNFKKVSGVDPCYKTEYDTSIIHHTCIFPISSSKDYRIKIELTDEVEGIESTVTSYCTLSR